MDNIANNRLLSFGAGFYGLRALEQYGSENVDFFIDNDSKKIGYKGIGWYR